MLPNTAVVTFSHADKTGKKVELARMNWQADSFHIYGKDIETAKKLLFDRIDYLSLEERTFNFSDDFIQEMYISAEPMILSKIQSYDESH